jgi:hypothetical protein
MMALSRPSPVPHAVRSTTMWFAAATLAALALASLPARAQGFGDKPYMGSFFWNTAQPAGYANDFIGAFSWLGFTFEGDRFYSPNFSTGIVLGWQELYDQTGFQQYNFPQGAATGTTYRHLMIVPILVKARYWTGETHQGRTMHPFFGAAIGTYYIRQTLDFGIYTAEESNWHFGLAPEAGIVMGQVRGAAWTLLARYNYAVKAGEYLDGKKPAWAYWQFGIGIGAAP